MTPQEIADIFAEIELKLIVSLKEALKAGKTVDYSSFKLQTLRSMEAYRKHCSDIWMEHLPMIEEETAELLETAYVDGVRDVQLQHERLFPDEDMEGELHQRFAGVNTRRMDSLIEDVNHNLHTAQTASLRMMDDVYREVVYKAEIHHATGAVTMPQAVDQAVKDFLERGINCIEYSNGRRVNIATYAEMALRTASLRSKLRGEAAKRREFGVDTVLVSQYGACSDTCLPWQGRVYIDDVWGDNTNIWVVDGRGQSLNGQWYPLLSEAVEGGLFHPNCRHGVTTWYEGVSRMPTPLDATAVRERSRLEQRQRELERNVRKWKRLEEGSQTPEAIAKYKRRRLDAQKALREFIREHDDVLRRDYWREKVYNENMHQVQQSPIMASDVINEKGRFDKEVALEKYKKFLLSVPEENRMYLQYYADNTEFLQDLTSKSAAAYSPRLDAVVYNDSFEDFWSYDLEEVITHELAHRADRLLFHSVDNEKFSNAISAASEKMLEPNQLDAFLSEYAAEIKDPCFSDIVSALFVKRHPLIPAGHSEKYWSVPGNKEREVFAELFTLQSLRNHRALQIIENEFPEMYRTYLEMLREVDII